MKTYQINRLLVVAAVAFLPIACGTSSVTGPDSSDSTVSALRLGEPLPPQAPPQSPEGDPVPVPSPKPEPSAEPDPGTIPAPAPTNRGGNRPAPQPDNTGVDTSPNAPTNDGNTGNIPAPPATDRGNTGGITVPVPPSGSPVPPSDLPVPEPTGTCDAVTVEIATLVTFRGTDGVSLEAILRTKDGGVITDLSCETVLWQGIGISSEETGRLVITYGQDSQHVTISGPAGDYKIIATTPNGKSATLAIVL
jgi:hypothetical protein